MSHRVKVWNECKCAWCGERIEAGERAWQTDEDRYCCSSDCAEYEAKEQEQVAEAAGERR